MRWNTIATAASCTTCCGAWRRPRDALRGGGQRGKAGAGFLPLPEAAAEDFPDRPLTLLVPFAPGGTIDVPARALATTSARRADILPEVQSVEESGVPHDAFATWVGLFVRGGAPEAATLAALRAPVVQERLRLATAEPIPAARADFAAYFAADVERWAAMVRAGRLQRAE